MSDFNNDKINNKPANASLNINFKGKKSNDPAKEIVASTDALSKEIGLEKDPAQVLGRSQVHGKKLSFEGKLYDNIANDLDFLNQNPQIVKKSDIFFEKAYNVTNDYSQAVTAQSDFVQEFGS